MAHCLDPSRRKIYSSKEFAAGQPGTFYSNHVNIVQRQGQAFSQRACGATAIGGSLCSSTGGNLEEAYVPQCLLGQNSYEPSSSSNDKDIELQFSSRDMETYEEPVQEANFLPHFNSDFCSEENVQSSNGLTTLQIQQFHRSLDQKDLQVQDWIGQRCREPFSGYDSGIESESASRIPSVISGHFSQEVNHQNPEAYCLSPAAEPWFRPSWCPPGFQSQNSTPFFKSETSSTCGSLISQDDEERRRNVVAAVDRLPDDLGALKALTLCLRNNSKDDWELYELAREKGVVTKLSIVIGRLKDLPNDESLLFAIKTLYRFVEGNETGILRLSAQNCFPMLVNIFSSAQELQLIGESARLMQALSETKTAAVEDFLIKLGLLEAVCKQLNFLHGFDRRNHYFLGIVTNLSHHFQSRADILHQLFPFFNSLLSKEDLSAKEAMKSLLVLSNAIVGKVENKGKVLRANKKNLENAGTATCLLNLLVSWIWKYDLRSEIKGYFDVLNKLLFVLRWMTCDYGEKYCVKIQGQLRQQPHIVQLFGRLLTYSGEEWELVRYNALDLVRNLSKGSPALTATMRSAGIIERLACITRDAFECITKFGEQEDRIPKWSKVSVVWYLRAAVETLTELAEFPYNRAKMVEIGLPLLIDTISPSAVGEKDSKLKEDCRKLKYAVETYSNPSLAARSPYSQLGSTMNDLSLASPFGQTESVPPNSPELLTGCQTPLVIENMEDSSGDDSSDTERSRILNSVLDMQEEMQSADNDF